MKNSIKGLKCEVKEISQKVEQKRQRDRKYDKNKTHERLIQEA